MKRIYIIIFALALSIVCRGEIVDADYAAKVAGRALSSKVKRVQKEAACFAASSLSASAPAYYVFQDDKGWAVIAGDDCAVPVLARGEGTLPDTDINGYEYDWDNMPLNPAKEGTAEGKTAIAQLLAHIGRSVKMDYDVGSSGAYGMSYSSQEPVVRGQNFGVELNRFANFYNVNTMKYRMVLTDRDNNVKEQISDEKEVKFLNGSTMSKYVSSNATCRINSDFVIGGHKAYKSVVWTYDGRELESKYPSVWLKKGPHTLEAKVTYVDDTVRTIVSEFTVTD